MSLLAGKSVFLVVGNPRAGTSAISHFLSNSGVHFGDPALFIDTTVHKHNPIFFELASVNRINDKVMQAMGGRWGDDFLPSEADFARTDFTALAAEARQLLVNLAPEAGWLGLKDPRFCFTFPFWQRVIRESGAELRLVWSLRAIDATLDSNQRLNNWPIEKAWTFLIQSLLCCRYFTRHESIVFLDYDKMIAQPVEFARDALRRLGFHDVAPDQAVSHVDPALCHHREPGSSGLTLLDLYDARLRGGMLAPEAYLDYRQMHCLARGQFVPPTHADLPHGPALILPAGWPAISRHVEESAAQLKQVREMMQTLIDHSTGLQSELAGQQAAILAHSRELVSLRQLASGSHQDARIRLKRKNRSLSRRIRQLEQELAASRNDAEHQVGQLRARISEQAMESLIERSSNAPRRVA